MTKNYLRNPKYFSADPPIKPLFHLKYYIDFEQKFKFD